MSDNKTYNLVLLFDPNASNKFQNSSVSIQVEIQAKQHRNTEGNWEMVAETMDASIDTSLFTVEYDRFGRVAITGIQDGVDFESLTDITIPEGVEVIPGDLFSYHEKLESVTLPSTLKEIGVNAFCGCSKLKTVNLPDGLEYIGYGAFRNCPNLTYIEIPPITAVDSNVFQNSGLKTVVLKEGFTTISYEMFSGCANLTTIVVPDSVVEIGINAFKCSSNVNTTVYTNNSVAKSYNWTNSKRSVTFLAYEAYTD